MKITKDSYDNYSPFRLLKDIFIAIISYFKMIGHNPTRKVSYHVREFYKQARGEEDAFKIVDLNNDYYFNILQNIDEEIFKNEQTSILDIGCGSLKLYKFLKNKNVKFNQYTGIDVFVSPSEKLFADKNEINLLEGDITNEFFYKNIYSAPNLFFMINILPYIKETNHVKKNIESLSERGNILVVIEPYPSLFWEKYFSNLKMYYRKPSKIDTILSGWKCTNRHVRYLYNIRGFYFWKVSGMSIYEKK